MRLQGFAAHDYRLDYHLRQVREAAAVRVLAGLDAGCCPCVVLPSCCVAPDLAGQTNYQSTM
jgi:hypothetical protein